MRIDWKDPHKELPAITEGKEMPRCLAYCRTGGTCGFIDVKFNPRTGWMRSENYSPIDSIPNRVYEVLRWTHYHEFAECSEIKNASK